LTEWIVIISSWSSSESCSDDSSALAQRVHAVKLRWLPNCTFFWSAEGKNLMNLSNTGLQHRAHNISTFLASRFSSKLSHMVFNPEKKIFELEIWDNEANPNEPRILEVLSCLSFLIFIKLSLLLKKKENETRSMFSHSPLTDDKPTH
jgi:hypothetical protein